MEGVRASSQVLKSPEEIEAGIISTQTVTWDPFTVLPKEIYVKIFDKLDNPDDKKNFMNTHVKFYALFKDKRTLFLFQDVFKEVCKICENFRIIPGPGPDSRDLRLVCRDWDRGVQTSFQLNVIDFLLDYKYYTGDSGRFEVEDKLTWIWHYTWTTTGEKIENDIRKFSVTHPTSRNPFLSRKLQLVSSYRSNRDEEEYESYLSAVDSLLKFYGQHIWHCHLVTDPMPETCEQMAKWLCLMPELKTLELDCEIDVDLGQLSSWQVLAIRDMRLVQPEMNKLEVLKSERLPSVVFNKLFGNLKQLEKIQIVVPWKGSFFRDYEIPPSRESLKEASFTFKIKELPDLLEYFVTGEPFPNLKKLGIDDRMELGLNVCLPWPEWKTTFKILEEKLPALEELSFRLAKAELDIDKENAKSQSLSATLNLPKLKKLWITLPNLASIDFLLPCRALEELKVVLECYQFNANAAGVEGREKIGFNVDLSTLWESNVWDVFPKLRVLDVEPFHSHRRFAYHHRYEKIGEQRKYEMDSHTSHYL